MQDVQLHDVVQLKSLWFMFLLFVFLILSPYLLIIVNWITIYNFLDPHVSRTIKMFH